MTVQSNNKVIKRIRGILLDDETTFVADVRNNYQIKRDVYRILCGGTRWILPRSVEVKVTGSTYDP